MDRRLDRGYKGRWAPIRASRRRTAERLARSGCHWLEFAERQTKRPSAALEPPIGAISGRDVIGKTCRSSCRSAAFAASIAASTGPSLAARPILLRLVHGCADRGPSYRWVLLAVDGCQ